MNVPNKRERGQRRTYGDRFICIAVTTGERNDLTPIASWIVWNWGAASLGSRSMHFPLFACLEIGVRLFTRAIQLNNVLRSEDTSGGR